MKRETVNIDKIFQEENSRSIYRSQDLQELMASMAKDGLLHPVGVKKMPNNKYELVFGNRRFMAAKKLGWHELDVSIIDFKSDEDSDSLNLVENLKRADITAHDEGRIYYKMQNLMKLSVEEICARVGVKSERVINALKIYREDIPKEFRARIVPTLSGAAKHQGKMSANVASELISIVRSEKLNANQRNDLFSVAFEKKLTMPQAKQIARIVNTGETVKSAMRKIESIDHMTISFAILAKTKNDVERKYGIPFHRVIMKVLTGNKELGIIPIAEAYKLTAKKKVETKVRQKAK